MNVICTGAMAFASGVAMLTAWRLIGGVASAFVLICASSLILERLQHAGRPELAGIHFAGVGVGIALSSAMVWVIDEALGYGWRVQWVMGGTLSLLALIAVARLLPVGDGAHCGTDNAAGPRRHTAVGFVLAYGLFGFGYVITATFLIAIVRASDTLRPFEPVVWLLVGVAAAPSVGLWTRIGARIGAVRAFSFACLLEALGIVASVMWVDLTGIVVAALLFGGTFMGIVALGLIGAREQTATDPRRMVAIMTVAFGVGQVLGPGFAGVLKDYTGSFVAPSLAAACALVAASLLAMNTRSRLS